MGNGGATELALFWIVPENVTRKNVASHIRFEIHPIPAFRIPVPIHI